MCLDQLALPKVSQLRSFSRNLRVIWAHIPKHQVSMGHWDRFMPGFALLSRNPRSPAPMPNVNAKYT
jgi:hypothetical protein